MNMEGPNTDTSTITDSSPPSAKDTSREGTWSKRRSRLWLLFFFTVSAITLRLFQATKITVSFKPPPEMAIIAESFSSLQAYAVATATELTSTATQDKAEEKDDAVATAREMTSAAAAQDKAEEKQGRDVKPQVNRYSRRLFLGIFTEADLRRMRHVIRTTYLAFNNKYAATAAAAATTTTTTTTTSSSTEEALPPPKVCSIAEFSNNTVDCQIVYAFVANTKYHVKFKNDWDMIFLDEGKKRRREGKKNTKNQVHELYQHLLKSYGTGGIFPFDYVAYTHKLVVGYPDRLWPGEMFLEQGGHSVYSSPKLYSWGDPKGDQQNTHDYTLLSHALMETVVKHPSFHAQVPDKETNKAIESIIKSSGSAILHVNSSTAEQVFDNSTTVIFPLQDCVETLKNDRMENALKHDFLRRWDAYKDTWLVTYKDPEEEARVRSNARVNHTINTPCRYGPRILIGIFTMQGNEKEFNRRAVIRKTYLNFYKESNQWTKNETPSRHRICSLADLVSSNNTVLLQECQMAYVFIAAGNPDGPTERVEFNTSAPMTLPSPSNEPDLALLNIRENMEDGKSQTFFKYATSIVDDLVYFEYIAKIDSDTIVYPEQFLNHNVNRLPRFPNNVRVYGGTTTVKSVTDIRRVKAPLYHEGLGYWMSTDLARYITSPACDRAKLDLHTEDRSIGEFVHSHPLPIYHFQLNPKVFQFQVNPRGAFNHPFKDITVFQSEWGKYLERRNKKKKRESKKGRKGKGK